MALTPLGPALFEGDGLDNGLGSGDSAFQPHIVRDHLPSGVCSPLPKSSPISFISAPVHPPYRTVTSYNVVYHLQQLASSTGVPTCDLTADGSDIPDISHGQMSPHRHFTLGRAICKCHATVRSILLIHLAENLSLLRLRICLEDFGAGLCFRCARCLL